MDGVESRADDGSSTDVLDTDSGTRAGADPDSNHVVITMPSGDGNHCDSTLTRSFPDSANTDDVGEPHDSAHSAPLQHRTQLPSRTTQAAADGDTAYGIQTLRRGHLPTFSSQSDDGSLHAAQSQQQAQGNAGAGAGIPSGGVQRLHTQAEHADEGECQASQSPESHQHQQQREQEQHVQQPAVAVANFVQLQQQDTAHNLQGHGLHQQGTQQGQRQHQQQQQQQEQLHQHPWQQQQQQLSRRSRSYTQSPRRHLQKRPSRIQPGGAVAANVSSAQNVALSQRRLGRLSAPATASASQTVSQSPFQSLSNAQTDVVPQTLTQPVQVGDSSGNVSDTNGQMVLATSETLDTKLQGLLDAAEGIKAAVQQMQQQLQGVVSK